MQKANITHTEMAKRMGTSLRDETELAVALSALNKAANARNAVWARCRGRRAAVDDK